MGSVPVFSVFSFGTKWRNNDFTQNYVKSK
jgi:hypothetical protein